MLSTTFYCVRLKQRSERSGNISIKTNELKRLTECSVIYYSLLNELKNT